ncbi:17526_t:CDS:1, partial [Cetraspora pellucida]
MSFSINASLFTTSVILPPTTSAFTTATYPQSGNILSTNNNLHNFSHDTNDESSDLSK